MVKSVDEMKEGLVLRLDELRSDVSKSKQSKIKAVEKELKALEVEYQKRVDTVQQQSLAEISAMEQNQRSKEKQIEGSYNFHIEQAALAGLINGYNLMNSPDLEVVLAAQDDEITTLKKLETKILSHNDFNQEQFEETLKIVRPDLMEIYEALLRKQENAVVECYASVIKDSDGHFIRIATPIGGSKSNDISSSLQEYIEKRLEVPVSISTIDDCSAENLIAHNGEFRLKRDYSFIEDFVAYDVRIDNGLDGATSYECARSIYQVLEKRLSEGSPDHFEQLDLELKVTDIPTMAYAMKVTSQVKAIEDMENTPSNEYNEVVEVVVPEEINPAKKVYFERLLGRPWELTTTDIKEIFQLSHIESAANKMEQIYERLGLEPRKSGFRKILSKEDVVRYLEGSQIDKRGYLTWKK